MKRGEKMIGDFGFKVTMEIDGSTIRIVGSSPDDDPLTLTASGVSPDGMLMFAEHAENYIAEGIVALYRDITNPL